MKPRFIHTKKTIVVDGQPMTFDSAVEADRYLYLRELEKSGYISDLTCQPCYRFCGLSVMTEKKLKTKTKLVERMLVQGIRYTADFSYFVDGNLVVEDVKGSLKILSRDVMLRFYMTAIQKKVFVNMVLRDKKVWKFHNRLGIDSPISIDKDENLIVCSINGGGCTLIGRVVDREN